MEGVINTLNNIIWSTPLVVLCLMSGLYFSFRTKFSQVRNIKEMVMLLFKDKNQSSEGISSFQALCTALAGRIGTGNIAGVATAIAMGGPGALFWMWVIAFFGAGSALAESTLGQIYKEEDNGEFRGGPAYYIEKGLGKTKFSKAYGILFAVVTLIATGVLLPGVQSNSIASGINNAFNIDVSIVGIFVVILLAFIIFGGIKRIASTAEFIVPFMGGLYVLASIIVVIINIEKVPEIFALIFNCAFNNEAIFSGIFGSTIAWGVKRGIYSNEAGQGTGPQAASAAKVSHPTKQGLVQSFSVYIDTLFVCTATGLMILMTNSYNVIDTSGNYIVENLPGVEYGPAFTQMALDKLLPGSNFGSMFIAVSLFFFAFTTIMSYYYIAEVNLSYLVSKLNKPNLSKVMINILRVSLLVMVFNGCVKDAELTWTMGDIGVGAMAWLNVIAILLLSNIAIKCFDDYDKKLKSGIKREDITFNPIELGIENADYWEELVKKDI